MIDYSKLIEAANSQNIGTNAQNIGTILCGHTHKQAYLQQENLKIYCAGSACSVDGDNAIHEIMIDTLESIVSVENFEWSAEEQYFI